MTTIDEVFAELDAYARTGEHHPADWVRRLGEAKARITADEPVADVLVAEVVVAEDEPEPVAEITAAYYVTPATSDAESVTIVPARRGRPRKVSTE